MNLKILEHNFKDQITDITSFRNEVTVSILENAIVPVSRFLRDSKAFAFDFLSDCCGVDRYPATPRFCMVYHLYSTVHNHRLRIKVPLNEDELIVDSIVSVWQAAEWPERECFDMFGIKFRNHPDMRRILMPDDFEGHPLRKDFPLEGL